MSKRTLDSTKSAMRALLVSLEEDIESIMLSDFGDRAFARNLGALLKLRKALHTAAVDMYVVKEVIP